jgi:translation initiation factor 1A
MPNVKGGKNYKKSKNSGQTEPEFFDRLDDQLYARVIKLLGNCNVLVFCNDGKRRLCHIRGGLRKKVWLNVGDLVLVSLRELGAGATDGSSDKWERGDIINKYDVSHVGKLKKDPTFNQVLLNQVERLSDDSDAWDKIMYKPSDTKNIMDGLNETNNNDGFEFDDSSGLEDAGDESEESHDERKKMNHSKSRENKLLAGQFDAGYVAPPSSAKKAHIDDIDIDAI